MIAPLVSALALSLACPAPWIPGTSTPGPSGLGSMDLGPLALSSLALGPMALGPMALGQAPISSLPLAVRPAAMGLAAVPDEGDEQYQYIAGLCERELWDLAAKEAADFLQSYRRHGKRDLARYRLATSLFELDRLEEARPHFETLTAIDGFEYTPEVWFRWGQCEMGRGGDAPAIRAFERVVASDRDYLHTPATFLLAEAQFRVGQLEEASRRYREVLASDTPAGREYARDARYGLSWCAFRAKDWDASVARIEEFLARHRGDELESEMRFLLGEAHLESGRPTEAIEAYGRVESGASRPGALRGLGFAHARLGNHGRAARFFGELLELDPRGPFAEEARLHRGIHLLEGGDAAAARRVLADAPGGAQGLYWLAQADLALGDAGAALGNLDRALGAQPGEDLRSRIQTARGDALFELGRGEEAAAAYGAAGSDYALHAAAIAKLNEGDSSEALAIARDLLERFPQSEYAARAYLCIGEVHLAQQKHDEARTSFEAAAAAVSTAEEAELMPRIGSRIAWCDYLGGNFARAASGFGKVARDHGDAPEAGEALYMQGRSLEAEGSLDQAQSVWRRYLQIHGEGEHRGEVRLGLARLNGEDTSNLEALLQEGADPMQRARALYELAERQARAGERRQAKANYARLVQDHGDSAEAGPGAYGLAFCQFEDEEYKAAAQGLDQLLTRPDLDQELRLSALELRVWCARRSSDSRAALEAFQGLARVCKDEARLFESARQTSVTFAEEGRRDVADSILEQVRGVLREPSRIAALEVERTWLALDDQDIDRAEVRVSAALAQAKDDDAVREAAFFVGEARFDQGDDAKAVALYGAAGTAGSPVFMEASYKRGFALLRSEDPAGAAPCFRAVVEGDPRHALAGECLFLLGECCYRGGDFEAAATALRQLRKDHRRHEVLPKALFRLGICEVELGRWREAQGALEELVNRNPDFPNLPEAELWRGRALRQLGNRRAARAALERTLAGDRGRLAAQARLELGGLALDGGDVEAALSQYLKVSVLFEDGDEVPEALFMAGQCLERQEDPAGAKGRYTELLKRFPKSDRAPEARARLESLGDPR